MTWDGSKISSGAMRCDGYHSSSDMRLMAGWSYFEVRIVELFTTAAAAAAPIMLCSGWILLCFGELWLKNTVMVIWGRSATVDGAMRCEAEAMPMLPLATVNKMVKMTDP